MLIRGHFLYLHVDVPEFRWLRFVVPVFVLTGLMDSLIDLLTLGALIAPKVKYTKKGMDLDAKTLRSLVRGLETFLIHLDMCAGHDLVNVKVGAENVKVKIKVF